MYRRMSTLESGHIGWGIYYDNILFLIVFAVIVVVCVYAFLIKQKKNTNE